MANRDFAHVFSWLVAAKYAVYHAGDPLATAAKTDSLLPLGHVIYVSPNHADIVEIKGYANEATQYRNAVQCCEMLCSA